MSERDFKWVCPNCKFLLGYISSGLEKVRIKYKDLYVVVSKGDIEINCRRCAEHVTLKQQTTNQN